MKKNTFSSKFISLLSSNIFSFLFGIITSIILARYLGPEGMGVKSILSNFPLLFVSFFEMGIRQSTIYYVGNKMFDENRIIGTIIFMWIFSSIVGLIIYSILSYFQFSGISALLISISALYIPISIARNFLSGFMIGKDQIKDFARLNFYTALIVPVLTVIFLVVFKMGVLGVLIANQLGLLITLLYRMHLVFHKMGLKISCIIDLKIIKSLVMHGVVYAGAIFLSTNMKIIPIYLMTSRLTNEEIGLYSAGVAFATLLYQVFQALGPILFANSANSADPIKSSQDTQMMLRVVFPFIVLGALVIFLLMDLIVPLMYGIAYTRSVPVTQVMLIGVVFYYIFLVLSMDLAGKGKPIVAIKSLILPFVLCVGLNYFSIERLGIIGAAISTSFSLALSSVSYLYFYSKELNVSMLSIISPRKSDWQYLFETVKRYL